MRYLKIFEEFDSQGYESHWDKFQQWLSQKDFDLYDGLEDLKSKFLEIANDDSLAVEEKSNEIAAYLDEKWGLYDAYMDVVDYLETKTKAEFLIWLGTCYGACDTPVGIDNLKIDLVIQFGHNAKMPDYC